MFSEKRCIFAGLILKIKTMTLVSPKEFNTYQDKYLDLAINEDVCIKRGDSMYRLMYCPLEIQYPEQSILEPDDDLRSAIPMTEVRDRVIDYIRRKNAMHS